MPVNINQLPRPLGQVLMQDPRMTDDAEFLRYVFGITAPSAADASAAPIEQTLMHALHAQFRGLKEARGQMQELGGAIDLLTAPPWQTATFIRSFQWPDGVTRALVAQGGRQSVVNLAQDIDSGSLAIGDGVFLAQAGNVILAKSPIPLRTGGETGGFLRRQPDGRLVVGLHDSEVVLDASAVLRTETLEEGDLLMFDRSLWLAIERVASSRRKKHQLEPESLQGVSRAQIGGQDDVVHRFLEALLIVTGDRDRARCYGLKDQPIGILLYGLPGNGKTTLARIGAAELQSRLGRKVSLFIVQPSEWTSPYVGQTEINIRRFFADVRKASENGGYSLAYFDEIEAIGRIRGSSGSTGHHHDRFLSCFLTELDGFELLRNVGVVASTNRPDLLDPALRDRLRDLQIELKAPGLSAARAIFAIHLPEGILFRPHGADADATRQEAIETAVSLLYGPNADNALCTVKLADGRERHVNARDLVSGRGIAQICRAAQRRALARDLGGGEPGITVGDVEEEVRAAIEVMRSTITVFNVRSYLPDLPNDIQVADVQPVLRRVARPRLRSAAAA